MSRTRSCSAALAAALLLLSAVPASAAGGITSPGAGEIVASDAVVALRAVVEGPTTAPSELSLQGPDAEAAEVVAVSTAPDGGELAYDFDTSCATRVCTGRAPAVNGTWTLRLSGAATDERTFVLRIAPVTPSEVSASPSESGVTVRWRQGDEPDLTGFRIEDAAGNVTQDGIDLSACDAERMCSAEVPEGAGAWAVVAFRSACPGCDEVLASAPSRPVRASTSSVKAPGAGALPGAGSSSPPAAGAQPGARSDQRAAFARSFGTGRPAAVASGPQGAVPPPVLPQEDGEFDQELGYGERDIVVSQGRPPLTRAQDAVATALGQGNRIPLLVVSALMIALAVWLRRWARRAISE